MTFCHGKGKTLIVVAVCGFAGACAGPDAAPPAPPDASTSSTIADPGMRADVLRQISVEETGNATGVQPRLISVRRLDRQGSTYIEQWTVQVDSDLVDYRVELNPTPGARDDYTVSRIR